LEHARAVVALRQGPWKLIPAAVGGRQSNGVTDTVQLYNLATDLGETRNLAAEQPDRVQAMSQMLKRLRDQGRSRP
jgi:hypothetical protein